MTQPLHIVCPTCVATNRIPAERVSDQPKCGQCHKPLFLAHPVELGSANFQQHISRNDIPLLVDFWAPWCGPCQSMAPALVQAAAQLEPMMRLAKLDTEAQQVIAGQYGIRSIPTLIVFKHGKEVARQAGAMGVADIVNWAKGFL